MELAEVPLRGAIPAGYPFPVEEQMGEYVEVPKQLLNAAGNRKDLFALSVSGESLIGDSIFSGDVVIVEPGQDVIDGRIYAVRLGNEVCARHVFRKETHMRLVSSNGNYHEIPATEVEILGRIILSGRWKKY